MRRPRGDGALAPQEHLAHAQVAFLASPGERLTAARVIDSQLLEEREQLGVLDKPIGYATLEVNRIHAFLVPFFRLDADVEHLGAS